MPAIEILNLRKAYGRTVAVDGLNLTIEEGELFSLLGVNGAGKTTTLRMLSCVTLPDEGDAILLGDSIRTHVQRVKAKINVSPQETAVARNLNVRENLEMMARLYGASLVEAQKATEEMLVKSGLLDVAQNRAKTLSGGMQRRLSIAMALITKPQILFLDEPTLGLDVLARRELWSVIRKLKGRVTVILTTHYMEEAEALSDRIGIMAKGRLEALGTVEELLEKTGASRFEDAFVAMVTETEAG